MGRTSNFEICPECYGVGRSYRDAPGAKNSAKMTSQSCPTCKGNGRTASKPEVDTDSDAKNSRRFDGGYGVV